MADVGAPPEQQQQQEQQEQRQDQNPEQEWARRVLSTHFPRPGQPGAPRFDGKNVSEFLEEWEDLASEYDLSDEQKVTKIVRYCDRSVAVVIKALPEFTERN
jgi:hypothetical protein